MPARLGRLQSSSIGMTRVTGQQCRAVIGHQDVSQRPFLSYWLGWSRDQEKGQGNSRCRGVEKEANT